MVKNIPIQNPKNPKIAQIPNKNTITNMYQNLLIATVMLPITASVAERFPKIISGMAKIVRMGTVTFNMNDIIERPMESIPIE